MREAVCVFVPDNAAVRTVTRSVRIVRSVCVWSGTLLDRH